jgi:hypothetical protein
MTETGQSAGKIAVKTGGVNPRTGGGQGGLVLGGTNGR